MIEQLHYLKGLAHSASCPENSLSFSCSLFLWWLTLCVCEEEDGEKDVIENQLFHILNAKPAKNQKSFSFSNVTADTRLTQFSSPVVSHPQ